MKKKWKNSQHKRHPITTVTQCRVPIFWPTNKPPRSKKAGDFIIKNQWGQAVIKNCKLTQVHRNLLDVIFTYHHGLCHNKDGCVSFLIDLYEIQNLLQVEATNHSWVFRKLEELRKTAFITETKKWVITGGIVRKHKYSEIDAGHTPDKFGPNKLYYVMFEAEFMKFFNLDMHMTYFPMVEKIINLKHPVSQALVRFCLSHTRLNMDLETILTNLGVFRPELDRPRKVRILQQLFLESEVLIKEFGIYINPMKNKRLGVFYTKHKEVWLELPPP